MPKNSSAARREQARALAEAEGISYTEALRLIDEAREAELIKPGDDVETVVAVVRKSKNRARRRQQSAPGAAYVSANAGTAH